MVAACWIYSKCVCIYSKLAGFRNSRKKISYKILTILGKISSFSYIIFNSFVVDFHFAFYVQPPY